MTGLARGLADDKTRVQLMTGLCHGSWKSELDGKSSVSVGEVGRTAPGSLEFWLDVKGFARTLANLIDPDTDLVVTSSFPSSLAARIFTENHHVKTVHYLHEAPMVLHDKEGLKALPFRLRLFYRAMSMLYASSDIEAVARSDTILANSHLSRKANAEAYGLDESRIAVVYPGVEITRAASSASLPELISRRLEKQSPLIFFPRGAQIWRNPDVCLQALKRLGFRFQAVFTGGVDYEGSKLMKRARALDIASEVLWIPELSNEDLNSIYSHSSLVVSIPKRQPFGLIPLEALMHGSPPIISSSSGVSEVLRDGLDTVTIHERDPQELASAIETLVSDSKLRRRIVFNGQRTIVRRLSLARFVEEMRENLYLTMGSIS